MKILRPEEYQPEAHRLYREIVANLEVALPRAQIEHVGSSSIPGCLSKGDLDVYVAVAPEDFQNSISVIEGLGYRIKQGTLRTKELCPFEGDGFAVDIGIQLVAKGSKFEFFLTFRDCLSNDKKLLEKYNQLKSEASQLNPDEYRRAKSAFIEGVLAKASAEPVQ